MRRLITLGFLLMFFTGSALAQSIYFRAGGGYGLPVAAAILGEKTQYTSSYDGLNTTNSSSTKVVAGSYGAGANFNFAVGYKFNENFIFELNTYYLISNKYKTFNNSTNHNTSDPLFPSTYYDNDNISRSAKGLFFNPSFIFSAGFGKAAPYGRFGIIAGSPKVTEKESIFYNGDGIDSTERTSVYSKGIAIGFQGAIGMNWKLSEKFDIYTELNFISMTYYPEEKNITKDINGDGFSVTDILPGMYMSQKQTLFKKKFDPSTVNTDSAKPQVLNRIATPLSSVSLQIGIRYNLWKKSE
jgi:hypothetical protein